MLNHESRGNPSIRLKISMFYFIVTLKSGIITVIRIHPLGTMNTTNTEKGTTLLEWETLGNL